MSLNLEKFLTDRYSRLHEIRVNLEQDKTAQYSHQGLQALFNRIIKLEGYLASVQEMLSQGVRNRSVLVNQAKDMEFNIESSKGEKYKADLDGMVNKGYSWEERGVVLNISFIDDRIRLKNLWKEVEELECFCKIMLEASKMITQFMGNAGLLTHLIKQGLGIGELKKED